MQDGQIYVWGALDEEISEYEPVKRQNSDDTDDMSNVTHLTFYHGELIILWDQGLKLPDT